MSKEPLLFLCHRIPFPPNKGDKIRSFNILKMLNEQYDVHLGCFIDDPFDKQYAEKLAEYSASYFTLDQNKTIAKIKGLSAFLTGKPITLPYYFDAKMQAWVDETLAKHNIKNVFCYSSSMAQYCQGEQYNHLQRVIDFVDIDSDKWRQYADKKTGIAHWVYNREYIKLANYEDVICADFDKSLFVSPDEANMFRSRQPEVYQPNVESVLNGVDVAFFAPDNEMAIEPLLPSGPFVSFTGAMDYWANIDAVLWFVEQVWPTIKKEVPQAKFVIAGGNPAKEIVRLAEDENIVVTGRVHDMRPYIAKASCSVAPLRIARGIQNKVLEAMALNRPVVCTSMAMEGINAKPSEHVHVVDDPELTAKVCVDYLKASLITECDNRAWIIEHFTWPNTLREMPLYFKEASNAG